MKSPTSETGKADSQQGPGSGSFKLAASDGEGEAIDLYLAHMLKLDASELYVTVDSPAIFRVRGEDLRATVPHTAPLIEAMIDRMLSPEQAAEFRRTHEFAAPMTCAGSQFRINYFMQQGASGFVARRIRTVIPTLDELGHPPVIKQIAACRRGLVLVVGGYGCGKSTTMASLIDYMNTMQSGHIVVIDETIDFRFTHKASIVTQREIGVDTLSYTSALKNIHAQSPDVVAIGDVRNRETIEAAFSIAEAGRLCIASIRANDALEAIERVLGFFDEAARAEVRLQLARTMRAVIGHRIVPAKPAGRVVAFEVMLDTPRIRELVKRGETASIKEEMEQLNEDGSCTFDKSLIDLWTRGRITDADAIAASDNASNIRSKLERLRGGAAAGSMRLAPAGGEPSFPTPPPFRATSAA